MKICIKNGTLISMDINKPKIEHNMDILIENTKIKYIDKNIILGTAYNNAPEKGHTIGRMAYYLGLDMDIPKDIYLVDGNKVYIPYERVDKSNVKDYFDKASD